MEQEIENFSINQSDRRAGIWLHIASLPGPQGIGVIGKPAFRFIDALHAMQCSVWQFLPTGPTGFGNSPYQALSSFAGNEMLIDLDDLVELGLLRLEECAALAALPQDHVDYDALIPIKSGLLDVAAERFRSVAGPDQWQAFEEFQATKDAIWLHDYSLFRVLKTQHQERAWPEWESKFSARDPGALAKLASTERERIEKNKIIQFLFFRQWHRLRTYASSKGVLLFGDLPIYVALDSADAWANRDLLRIDANGVPDCVAGVPPDYFSDDGQLWGNPLYAWERHAADGYRWWTERLLSLSKLVDLIRIDHFRAFDSYWAVPYPAENARNGRWEAGPGDHFFAAIRAALGELPIIAEDLGDITPAVEELRVRQNFPGMCVLQFELADPEFDLCKIAADRVFYTGTHDNDTVVGWFQNEEMQIEAHEDTPQAPDAALRIANGDRAHIHRSLVSAVFESPACLAMTSVPDLLGLGSEARLNTPGQPEGNWSWRVNNDQLGPEFCQNVASLVLTANRGNNDG